MPHAERQTKKRKRKQIDYIFHPLTWAITTNIDMVDVLNHAKFDAVIFKGFRLTQPCSVSGGLHISGLSSHFVQRS